MNTNCINAQSARLKSLKTVELYHRDAKTLCDIADARKWSYEHLVDKFRGQRLLTLDFSRTVGLTPPKPLTDWIEHWKVRNPTGSDASQIAETMQRLSDTDSVRSRVSSNVGELTRILQQCHGQYDVVKDQNDIGKEMESICNSQIIIQYLT